jgi:hypothetical protein
MDNWDAAAGTLRALVVRFEDKLTERDVENIWELINVGELGIAFETLCTQLDEYDVVLDHMLWREFAEVGGRLTVDPKYWNYLKP